MAYNPTVSVQIAINAVKLTRQGFGTPIFICSHQQTDDRVIDITDPAELLEDYGFLTSSNAYKASLQFFKNSPAPTVIQIGRRGSETRCSFTIPDAVTDETFGISAEYLSQGGTTYDSSFTTTAGTSTKEDIVDALKLELDGLSGFTDVLEAEKVGSGDTVSLVIRSLDNDYTFKVTSTATSSGATLPQITEDIVGIESASDTYTNIKDFNQDFYFVTTEVRSHIERLFVEDLATLIETEDKQFFTSTDQLADINDEDVLTSFTFKAFYELLTHTVILWHHEAIDFPECYYVGFNAPYDAGSVTWCNLLAKGIAPSSQPSNPSKPLTTSQMGRLIARNANFIQRDAGVNVIRTGITSGGEWIDVIRGVHWLTEDMTSSLKTLLYNQHGKKVPYNNQGIAQVRETMSSSLQRAVSRGFLDSFVVTLPLMGTAGASYQDFVDRALRNAKFTGILAGAIHTIEVKGEVTPPADA